MKYEGRLILKRLWLVLSLWSAFNDVDAQLFIGITGDLGNRVESDPNAGVLLKTPVSLSGSVSLLKQAQMRNNWNLQYGVAAGIVGYRIKFLSEFDTISVGNDQNFYTSDLNYNSIYFNVHLGLGKEFRVQRKFITLFLGAGITYYFNSDLLTSNYRCEVDPCALVFQYEMISKERNVKSFTELAVQTELNSWMSIGLRYRHHFGPALKGTYNFYHIKDPPGGILSLTQRALGVIFLIRVGK